MKVSQFLAGFTAIVFANVLFEPGSHWVIWVVNVVHDQITKIQILSLLSSGTFA